MGVPQSPSNAPSGSVRGVLGGTYTYAIQRIGGELEGIQYGWDWNGDNVVDEWVAPRQASPELETPHTWVDIGYYDIQVKTKDSTGESTGFSPSFTVFIFPLGDVNNDTIVSSPADETALSTAVQGYELFQQTYSTGNYWAADCNQDGEVNFNDLTVFNSILGRATNNQPETPSLYGEQEVPRGSSSPYSISSSATQAETLFYQVNWGDETSSWFGPYDHDELVHLEHSWDQTGIYTIQTRVKDQYNEQSTWSEGFEVTVEEPTMYQLQGMFSDNPVYELTQVTLTVTAQNLPVADADVTIPWDTTFSTDDQGQVRFTTPSITEDTAYTISIQKEGYVSKNLILSVQNYEPVLDITVASSVFEGEQFTVTITSDGEAVVDALVLFGDHTETSDDAGKVVFTAPTVATTSHYTIRAQKAGHTDGTRLISVVNQQEQLGYIFGRITDDEGVVLSKVQVCFQPVSGGVKICTLTDEHGIYTRGLSPGDYTVSIIKQQYQFTDTPRVTIEVDNAYEHNYILSSASASPSSESQEEEFIDYSLQDENIGAMISFEPSDHTITYRLDDLTIDGIEITDAISFQVSAPSETPATILVIQIPDSVIDTEEAVAIEYDDATLQAFTDVESFFDLEENSENGYLELVTTSGQRYVFIRVLHFSTHQIVITPQYLLSQLQSIGVFIGLLFTSLVVFLVPVYYLYYRKPEE